MSIALSFIAAVIKGIFWSLSKFIIFFLKVLRDLCCLVMFLCIAATLFRLPKIIKAFKKGSHVRGKICKHFFYLPWDALILCCFLFICITLVRVPELIKIHNDKGLSHSKIFKQFWLVFTDIFFLPLALFTLLFPPRAYILYTELSKKDKYRDRVEICFICAACVPYDYLGLFSFLFVVISWRRPHFWKKEWTRIINDRKSLFSKVNRIWGYSIWHFMLLFVDLFHVLIFLPIIFSWRNLSFFKRLIEQNMTSAYGFIWKNAGRVFIDIPTMFAFVFVCLTVYRAPEMIRKAKISFNKAAAASRSNGKHSMKCYNNLWDPIWTEFMKVICDISSIVIIILTVITLWRIPPMIMFLRKKEVAKKSNDANLTEALNDDATTTAVADGAIGSSDEDANNVTAAPSETTPSVSAAFNNNNNHNSHNNNSTHNNNGNTSNMVDGKDENKPFKRFFGLLKNLGFLFLDIPALLLLPLILITVFKVPSLLVSVKGKFYSTFAIHVFLTSLEIFVSLSLFVILFLLSLLQPFYSVVIVFEDRNHALYRIHNMAHQKLKSLVHPKRRQRMYDTLDDKANYDIKTGKIKDYLNEPSFNHEVEKLIPELDYHCGTLLKEVLQLEAVNHFYEEERQLEQKYLVCQNTELYLKNKSELTEAKGLHREKIEHLYKEIVNYRKPKVPLWKNKNGFLSRSFKENIMKVAKSLPDSFINFMLLLILAILPLYRSFTMFKKLKKNYWNRRRIVLKTIKDYILDFLACIEMCLLIITVVNAVEYLWTVYLLTKQTKAWKRIRKATHVMFLDLGVAILNCLSYIFKWKTYRYLATEILVFFLFPLHFLEKTMKILEIWGLGSIIAFVLYITIFGLFNYFLFFLIPSKGDENGQSRDILFSTISGVCLFMMFIYLIQRQRATKETQKFLLWRCTIENIEIIIKLVLDFVQMSCLCFTLVIPVRGREILSRISGYFLLDFGNYHVTFWITFTLFMIHFLVSSAPLALGPILKINKNGETQKSQIWQFTSTIFGELLFITITYGFLLSLDCNFVDGVGFMKADDNIQCWTGIHRFYGSFGFSATMLYWFSTLAGITDKYLTIEKIKDEKRDIDPSDIQYSRLYRGMLVIFKALIITFVLFISNATVALSLVLSVLIVAFLFSILYSHIYGHSFCNNKSYMVLKFLSIFGPCICALVCLIFLQINQPNTLAFYYVLIGAVVIMAIVTSIATKIVYQPSPAEYSRNEYRSFILDLEKELYEKDAMLKEWGHMRKSWRKMINTVPLADNKNLGILNERFKFVAEPKPLEVEKPQFDGDGRERETNSFNDLIDDYATHDTMVTQRETGVNLFGIYEVNCGSDLLITMESYIRFNALDVKFMQSKRHLWLQKVRNCTWSHLLSCAEELQEASQHIYYDPTCVDETADYSPVLVPSIPEFTLLPKPFIPEFEEELRALSMSRFEEITARLNEGEMEMGENAKRLIRLLLPNELVAEYAFTTEFGGYRLNLTFYEDLKGTIGAVSSDGIPVATGAHVFLEKNISLFWGCNSVSNEKATISSFSVKKGIISLSFNAFEVTCSDRYLITERGKCNLNKVLVTLESLNWAIDI